MEDLLQRVEALIRAHLPEAAQAKVAAIDAWGEGAGVAHAGALAVVGLLALALLVSLLLLSGGGTYSAGGGGGGWAGGKGRRKGRGKDGVVILLGPCGAGKTAIYHQLLYGQAPETVTSMESSEGSGALIDDASGRTVSFRLVDFPGHERLRRQWVPTYLAKGSVAGVCFVVDAAEFTPTAVREAADFLYDILTHARMEEGPPVLVACNKSDVPGAKGPSRIKTLLTQELDKLRKTKGAASHVGAAGASGLGKEEGEEEGERLPLGRQGQPLNLDVDAPSEVSFAALSVVQEQGAEAGEEDRGLGPLRAFILHKALL